MLMYIKCTKTQCILLLVQKMFFKFDKDRSGTLEKQEVYEAVRSLGKNPLLNLLNAYNV